MKTEKRITKQAQDLCAYKSKSWLSIKLGLDHRTMQSRIDKHSWRISEAELINNEHEKMTEELR